MAVALRPDLHQAPILRKSASEVGYAAPDAAPAPASNGAALPAAVQAKMERSLGADFSNVRIHQGPQAQAMGALAYTQGTDIHFAPGQYDPTSQRGQELLGHELTHVVQQAQGRVHGTAQTKGGPGINDDASLEREADEMGARAARGEVAGGHAPAPGGPSRGASAPVQRMIDEDAPAATKWDEIQRFLHATLINERKQTFAQAVEEFIATEAQGFATVKSKWEALARESVRQGKVPDALRTIQEIIDAINTAKIAEPDHPNKPGSEPEDEQYGTIPQSAESKRIAAALRTTFLAEMYGRKYNAGANTYDRNPIQGAWKKDFMLGVLILPDKTVHVSHSGFMGPTQSALFASIVTTAGYEVATHDGNAPYQALQDTYKHHLQHDITMPAHHQVVTSPHGGGGRGRGGGGGRGRGRGRGGGGGGGGRTTTQVFHYDNTDTNVIEKGNPLGLCAAPQGLHTVDSLTAGDFPARLEGETPMALTEVLVRDVGRQGVTVKDKGGRDIEYKGNQDVPSCLSCQVQLRHITKLLTDRRRNVVNRQNIRERNGEDVTQAVALLKNLLHEGTAKALIDKVLGKGGIALDKVPDLGALEAAEAAYRKALEDSALELTEHPELVASNETHPGKQKELPGKLRGALGEKQLVVRSMIDGKAYNDHREQVSRAGNVGEKELETRKRHDQEAAQQVREEESLLERAQQHLDSLFRYRVQGFLTVEQETHYARALGEYHAASRELAGTSGGDTTALNNRIEQAMSSLPETIRALEQDLENGKQRSEELREEKARELQGETEKTRAPWEHDKEQRQREPDEDALRRAAEAAAISSSQRQERRAQEEQDRLEAVAFGIAQAYGTSIDRALALLTNGGRDGRYTPERDDSNIADIYS